MVLLPKYGSAFQPGPPTPKEEFDIERRVLMVSFLPPGSQDEHEFFAQRKFVHLFPTYQAVRQKKYITPHQYCESKVKFYFG